MYVDIIIVGYRVPDIELECIETVIHNTKYSYVLTYIDNYHTGYTLTQAWNKLIKASMCDYICLLNSDTAVSEGWLSKMMDTLLSDKQIGFVGPSTNNCHSPQKEVDTECKADVLASQEDVMEVMKDPISGFCVLFRRAIWEQLGGFNEKYKLYGQESDFIDRAQQAGYKAVWRKDAFVFHHGEVSVKKHGYDVETERNRAKKIYWGDRRK